MAKLGYTFYPKDWRSSMNVLELSLQEKGFYRELIDECFIQMSSNIYINERTFCRLHGINLRTFEKVLQKLSESSLIVIENFEQRLIHIPSIINRLGVIEGAVEGGKKSSRFGVPNKEKKVAKHNINGNNKEKENKTENKYYSKIVDFWLKEFKTDYVFNAKDGKKVKSIISQIEKKLEFQKREINEESVVESFKWVCKNLPEFYKNQDLSVIDSKFNSIVDEIKSNKNGNRNNKNRESLQNLKEQSEAVLRNFASE